MADIKKFYDNSYDYIETANIEVAIKTIKDLYIKNDICLDELLKNIMLPNISISDTIVIYETLIKEIDGDSLTKFHEDTPIYNNLKALKEYDKNYNIHVQDKSLNIENKR